MLLTEILIGKKYEYACYTFTIVFAHLNLCTHYITFSRYCMTLMEDFIQSEGDDFTPRRYTSLAKCVADARRACKLRYIVGSAPVCYGVPVYNIRSTMDDISCSK